MKNIYIDIIELGFEIGIPFTKDYFLTKIDNKSEDLVNTMFNNARYNNKHPESNLESVFIGYKIKVGHHNKLDTYIISYNAHFNYYDYIELQQARDNAKSAKTMSFIAILISGLLALGSILLQIFQPIQLNPNQLEKITLSNKEIVDEIYDTRITIQEENNKTNTILKDTNQYLDDIDSRILKYIDTKKTR